MSPSIEVLERRIGREVKRGDILVNHAGDLLEVANPRPNKLSTGLKTLTGADSGERKGNALRGMDLFKYIIRVEDRTDIEQDA